MFSGKTEELIRRLNRAQIARQKVQAFRSNIDKRYSETELISHSGKAFPFTSIVCPENIAPLLEVDTEIVAIDEVQFLDESIVNVVNAIADSGKRVIVAGLDMDYMGNPFGPMPQLLAIAERVDKLSAVCIQCGNTASRSFLKSKRRIKNEVKLGATESYEARCRSCFNKS